MTRLRAISVDWLIAALLLAFILAAWIWSIA